MREFRFHHTNLDKHNVTREEVYECFKDSKSLLRRSGSGTYMLLGKTLEEDLLHIVFRVKGDRVTYVFHARPANERELRQYRTRGK